MRKLKISFLIVAVLSVTLSGSRSDLAAQEVDSVFTIYHNLKGAAQERVGEVLLKALQAERYTVDSSYFSAISSEKELILVKSTLDYYFKNESYSRSFIAAQHLVELSTPRHDTANMIWGYYYMGFSCQRSGILDKALQYNVLCYELASASDDLQTLSSVMNNIGNVYMTNKKYDDAISYFKRSIEIWNRLGLKDKLAVPLGNLSTAYLKQERYEEALQAAREALAIDKEMKRSQKVAIHLNQLGNIFMLTHRYDSALECQHKSYAFFEETGSEYGQTITLHAIGETYEGMGKTSSAINHYERALSLAKKNDNIYLTQSISHSLYSIYRHSHPDKALEYYEQYVQCKDSIFNEENQKLINNFKISYETKEMEAKIANQARTIAKDRLLFWVFACGLILITTILLLISNFLRLKKRRYNDLKKINEMKDKFLSLFSHDLKNSTLSQQMVLHHLKNSLHMLSHEELSQSLKAVSDSADAQVELLLNLLNWARFQTSRIEFTPTAFPIAEVVESNIKVFDNQAKDKQISFNVDVPADTICYSDRNMISAIIRNYISNAIKFSKNGQTIDITLTEKAGKWLLNVIDHGIGISPENQERIFKKDIFTTTGTKGETGSSIGLYICNEIADLCHEELTLDSVIGSGSVFSITISKEKKS